jgi:hypothetical protein
VANPQTCRVSFTDPEGVTHSVVVSAASVYEAAALAVAEFRRAHLAEVIVGPGTRLQIAVEAPAMSHELSNRDCVEACDIQPALHLHAPSVPNHTGAHAGFGGVLRSPASVLRTSGAREVFIQPQTLRLSGLSRKLSLFNCKTGTVGRCRSTYFQRLRSWETPANSRILA